MDPDLFVQCAAKVTAVDGLCFQGFIFLMFLSCYKTNLSFLFVCFWNCRFKMVKKKQYQLKTVWY